MTTYTTPLAAYPNRAMPSTQGLACRAASSACSPALLSFMASEVIRLAALPSSPCTRPLNPLFSSPHTRAFHLLFPWLLARCRRCSAHRILVGQVSPGRAPEVGPFGGLAYALTVRVSVLLALRLFSIHALTVALGRVRRRLEAFSA